MFNVHRRDKSQTSRGFALRESIGVDTDISRSPRFAAIRPSVNPSVRSRVSRLRSLARGNVRTRGRPRAYLWMNNTARSYYAAGLARIRIKRITDDTTNDERDDDDERAETFRTFSFSPAVDALPILTYPHRFFVSRQRERRIKDVLEFRISRILIAYYLVSREPRRKVYRAIRNLRMRIYSCGYTRARIRGKLDE